MLSKGSDLVNNQKLNEAIIIFSKVIDLDPEWAEAWNKRATVLYLIGEYQGSQNDINKVLQLEDRHFGALAGQGLVNIQLKNYEKAMMSYEKAKSFRCIKYKKRTVLLILVQVRYKCLHITS